MKIKIRSILFTIVLSSMVLAGCQSKSKNPSSTRNSSSPIQDSSSSSSSGSSINTPQYYEGYYQSISTTDTDSALRKNLYNLMNSTHKTYTSYNSLKNYYSQTDKDPNNAGNIYLCYTYTSRAFNGDFSGSINREHVWPQSKGGFKTSGPGSDAHHVRPCDSALNNTRANLDFDEVPNGKYVSEAGVQTMNRYDANAFEPQDESKGDIARTLFYLAMHYGPESSYNLTFVDRTGNGNGTSIGKISTLLKWNLEFPVNEIEMARNEAVYKIQGNRNPFIDHPEFACKIWGNFNSNTQSVCQ